jgi:hypothetical protein
LNLNKENSKLHNIINILFVYTLVTFAWIFFRSDSLHDAFNFIHKILEFDFGFNLVQICAEKGPLNLLLSFFVIGLLFMTYLLPFDFKFKNKWSYFIFNLSFLIIIILIGVNGKGEFIYFQF